MVLGSVHSCEVGNSARAACPPASPELVCVYTRLAWHFFGLTLHLLLMCSQDLGFHSDTAFISYLWGWAGNEVLRIRSPDKADVQAVFNPWPSCSNFCFDLLYILAWHPHLLGCMVWRLVKALRENYCPRPSFSGRPCGVIQVIQSPLNFFFFF